MELSSQARSRSLLALLATTFLMYGGFFMVIPLVSIHYVDDIGLAAATVGGALAIRQVLQQGMTLGGGILADRWGVRNLIAAGVFIRAIGFVSLAFAETAPLLFVAMILSALGGALFEAPSRAAVAALTTEEDRARYFAISGIVSGVAMTAGPLLGALLLRFSFQAVSLAAAACFLIVFFITLFVLPQVQVAAERQSFTYGIQLAIRDWPFLAFTVMLMGYWFMWVQITISLPLVAREMAGSADAVSILYTVNAGLTALLQYPLLRLSERYISHMATMVVGVTIMALGLGTVALANDFSALLLCVVVFAVGTALATPTQQTVSADLADQRALGSYFGINALALAFGGGLGNFSGGRLIDLSRETGLSALPWTIFCAVGLLSVVGLCALGLVLLRRNEASYA
ncbi:MFS transporter [Candidatus Gracilibacteria bacterium]|nr:MFS transporter [Candidatus Gracilibacteria bacterium]